MTEHAVHRSLFTVYAVNASSGRLYFIRGVYLFNVAYIGGQGSE
jgi:hypothetical protein